MQIIASVIVVVCVVVGLGVLGALLMRRRRAMQARRAHAHWFHQPVIRRVTTSLGLLQQILNLCNLTGQP